VSTREANVRVLAGFRYAVSGYAFLWLAAWILPLATAQAEMPAFRHDRLNIFPAGAVAAAGHTLAVDGDLADWNPAAFVTMAADLDNMPRYAMQVAAAYDDQGLLLAVRFTDDTPLINRVDPIGGRKRGRSSFEVRLSTSHPSMQLAISRHGTACTPGASAENYMP
jgi:hypothetical protein